MEIKFFLNKNNQNTADNQPDYRGKVVIDGTPHKIAGWKKNGQYGESIACTLSVDTYQKPSGYTPPKNEPIDETEPF